MRSVQGAGGITDLTKRRAWRVEHVYQAFNSSATHDLDREQATVHSPLQPLEERIVLGTVQRTCERRADLALLG